jgi:hypothetical protein
MILIIGYSLSGCVTYSISPETNESAPEQNTTATYELSKPTTSLQVTPPESEIFTVTLSSTTLAYWDQLTAEVSNDYNRAGIRVWFVGDKIVRVWDYPVNYYHGIFSTTIFGYGSEKLPVGEYLLMVQSPGENSRFELGYNAETGMVVHPGENGVKEVPVFNLSEEAANNGPQALLHVSQILDSALFIVDDQYQLFNFTIEAPFLDIDRIETRPVGDLISIKGTTNLKPGNEMFVEIVEGPGIGKQTGDWSHRSGLIKIQKESDQLNSWEFVFDSSGMHPNWYYVFVEPTAIYIKGQSTFTLSPPLQHT